MGVFLRGLVQCLDGYTQGLGIPGMINPGMEIVTPGVWKVAGVFA